MSIQDQALGFQGSGMFEGRDLLNLPVDLSPRLSANPELLFLPRQMVSIHREADLETGTVHIESLLDPIPA